MKETTMEQVLKFIQENKGLSDEEIMDIYKQNSMDNSLVKNKINNIPKDLSLRDRAKIVDEITDPYMIKHKGSEDILRERGYHSFRSKGKTAFKNKATGKVLKSLIPGIGLVASGLAEAFDAEEVGRDSDMSLSEPQKNDLDLVRDISKEDDTLTQTRLKALQRMLRK